MECKKRIVALEKKIKGEEPEELTHDEKQLLCIATLHWNFFLNAVGCCEANRLYIKSYSAVGSAAAQEYLSKLTDEELNQLEAMIYERDRKDVFGMPTLDSNPVYDPVYLNEFLRNPETFPDDIRQAFKEKAGNLAVDVTLAEAPGCF